MIDLSHRASLPQNQCMLIRWVPIIRVTEKFWALLKQGRKNSLDTHIYDMLYMSCCPTASIKCHLPKEFDGRAFNFFLLNRAC